MNDPLKSYNRIVPFALAIVLVCDLILSWRDHALGIWMNGVSFGFACGTVMMTRLQQYWRDK